MGFRKIIGFGGSSHVVSLPKDWVDKNGLKKGDVLSIEEEDSALKVSPVFLKQNKDVKTADIDFDGNLKRLKAQLIYAYMNNFAIIHINGKDLFKYLSDIRGISENLIALEIIQQTPQRIVLKDFLNVNDVSIHDTVRRMDRIVMSMAEDVKTYLLGKNIDLKNALEQKELDINRLSNLVFKTLKRGFNSSDRAILKLNLDDVFYYWELTLFVEKIGDQIKRIPRYLKPGVSAELIKGFDNAIEQYVTSMKANFTRDHELALDILTRKRDIYTNLDRLSNIIPAGSMPGLEKIKNINNYSGNIVKVFLKLGSKKNNQS